MVYFVPDAAKAETFYVGRGKWAPGGPPVVKGV